MNKVKIAIFASFIVLIVLIVISILLARLNKIGESTQNTLQKTNIETTTKKTSKVEPKNLTKDQQTKMIEQAKSLPVLQGDDVNKYFELQDKMPYETDDFEIGYSDLTGKFYINKKTSKADEELDRYLQENDLINIFNKNKNLFEFTKKRVAQTIQEKETPILKYRLKKPTESTVTQPGDYEKVKQENLEHNLKVLQKLVSELASPSTGGTDQLSNLLFHEENATSAGVSNSENLLPINIPTTGTATLDSIFNEAGLKVEVPPKILRGVMSRECPPLINMSEDLVAQYSAPGNGLPPTHGCFKNSIGASGPMQFMPGTWPGYSSAVNKFGGYTHTPYIENIRDAVYASAWKLKRDSGASGFNWTYDQVKKAVICYNAGCGRLGNPPSSTLIYFNAVWKMYTAN